MFIFLLVVVGSVIAILLLLSQNTASQTATQTPLPPLSPFPSSTTSATASPTITDIVTNATTATIQTAKGAIVMKLYPQDAPKTVANFATLAKRGYYTNLTFHRVEAGFVIQGGDPKGDGSGGTSIYGDTFMDELDPKTPSYQEGYTEGVVAMANRGPNTNGSQFFIMLADNQSLPKNYTIFGKVTSGMDVVKKIAVGDKMTTITVE